MKLNVVVDAQDGLALDLAHPGGQEFVLLPGERHSVASSRRRPSTSPTRETGKNVWWRFRRADGDPWGLAGLWNTWTDKVTGEVHDSHTMLTVNADDHPLMRRMHKPDPKAPADHPYRRSVIPLDPANFDEWLEGTLAQALALM